MKPAMCKSLLTAVEWARKQGLFFLPLPVLFRLWAEHMPACNSHPLAKFEELKRVKRSCTETKWVTGLQRHSWAFCSYKNKRGISARLLPVSQCLWLLQESLVSLKKNYLFPCTYFQNRNCAKAVVSILILTNEVSLCVLGWGWNTMDRATGAVMRRLWEVSWLPWCKLRFIVTTGPGVAAKNWKDTYSMSPSSYHENVTVEIQTWNCLLGRWP